MRAPLWSYKSGLQYGFIPTDPREAYGACASLGIQPADPFPGTYSSWQTGGAGAGTIQPSAISQIGVWPPAIAGITPANQVALLPTYTDTGAITTLPTPTFMFTADGKTSTISAGNGWVDAHDTEGGVTPVAGCTYPDPWNAATGVAVPVAACTGPAARKREEPAPLITPPPR